LTPVIASVPGIAAVPDTTPVSAIEELTRASVSDFVAYEVQSEESPLSATADLLEALRKKRAQASVAAEPEVAEVAEVVEVAEVAEEPKTLPVEEIAPAPIAPAKKGRPSMPSWDEIVFGTKTED
jgi:hypothetical protein